MSRYYVMVYDDPTDPRSQLHRKGSLTSKLQPAINKAKKWGGIVFETDGSTPRRVADFLPEIKPEPTIPYKDYQRKLINVALWN